MPQRTAPDQATLSESTFDQLRRLIRKHAGITFRDNKRYLLESRLRPRLATCEVDSYEAYVRYVKRKGHEQEITNLVNAVTINETSFFRNPAQFEALEQSLLPALAARRKQDGARTVRLWSAACASGDEAYSLAILVREQVSPRFPRLQFKIVATDIDTEVLAAARAGRYSARAVRNVPTAYLHKFFERSGEAYVIDAAIRDMVTFHKLNLADAHAMRTMQDFDVIVCANVLIYFDGAEKQRLLRALADALNPGGYLLVGGSEALSGTKAPFQPVRVAGTLAYQRAPAAAEAAPPRSRASA
jgi:chemotaxis protein methyltransferase CheR